MSLVCTLDGNKANSGMRGRVMNKGCPLYCRLPPSSAVSLPCGSDFFFLVYFSLVIIIGNHVPLFLKF